MNDGMFSQIDFGPLKPYLENDDITDISYSNSGQVWLKTLSRGIYRADIVGIDNAFMEKLAFQCSNVMGKAFNMAQPFLDAEGAELRLNFVHESIARNGIAVVIRKTPAKIRLEKNKLLQDKYIDLDIHDFLIYCVQGHCNIIACGETGSGKTEFIKYLAAHTKEDEKLITIEDTLELHLDRIFPHRDIVTMKTNNIASYSDVLVTCMRQNPKWILLSEVRSAEAVMAVRNSISSGHYILSTIHADKASSIPSRMYSLLETNQDIEQFMKSIYRYIQLGVYIRGYQDKVTRKFHREIAEVTEFYVTENNEAGSNTIYKKSTTGNVVRKKPSKYLIDYLDAQGVVLPEDVIVESETKVEPVITVEKVSTQTESPEVRNIFFGQQENNETMVPNQGAQNMQPMQASAQTPGTAPRPDLMAPQQPASAPVRPMPANPGNTGFSIPTDRYQ
ncbi:MAG: CpaF/VirB11 family protein [Bacilli bacterium]|nr:CpaF/VirB11 family protein [Bacilli bacterium]